MPSSTVPVWLSALLCRCPRFGKGRLFTGLLTVREQCEQCGLDLRGHDSGDGPATLAIFIVAPIVVGLALWVEFRLGPPIWVHLVLWPIVVFVLTMACLRPMKAAMIALQYRHRSSEMDL